MAAVVIPALIGLPTGGKPEVARCAQQTTYYRISCSEDVSRSVFDRAVAPESKTAACFVHHKSVDSGRV